MFHNRNFCALLALIIMVSCAQKAPYGDSLIKPEIILKDQISFVNYWYSSLDLSQDFIGLNASSQEIPKGKFLKQVASGNFLPLRLVSDPSSPKYYKLYKLSSDVDNYIKIMLRTIGSDTYKQFEWEGKSLPEIDYTDLKGKKYDSNSIKSKIMVLDFWFIGCTSCVREMPELNKLRAQYINREDMLFAAIAFDKEDALRKFLKRTDFQYDIISDSDANLVKKLGIRVFPTSIIVKNGKIVKILDDQYHSLSNLKIMVKKEAER